MIDILLTIFMWAIIIAGILSAIYLAFYTSRKWGMKNKIKALKEEIPQEILSEELRQYYIDSNEEAEAITGKKLALQYKGRGSVKQGFACLTKERIYVLGKHKKNKKRTTENDNIRLHKVTNIYMEKTYNVYWLLSILFKTVFILFILYLIIHLSSSNSSLGDSLIDFYDDIRSEYGELPFMITVIVSWSIGGAIILISIPLAVSILYDTFKLFTDKIIRLTIQHTEGCLDLTYSWLNEEETVSFIAKAQQLCNKARADIKNNPTCTVSSSRANTTENTNIARLERLYEMYKNGMITEEEFDNFKSNIS